MGKDRIMELTGAKILMKALKEEGTDTIFGYPGGQVIDIYDELVQTDIRHILVRHEQGAVHAADGYARACGRVGVCLVTSGPGATNTVTGIASAYMDSIPLVVITGQVPTHLIGIRSFQEVNIVGITKPCTKRNYQIRRTEDIPGIIKKAFHTARSGRPGPVLVDIPKNVATGKISCQPEKIARLKNFRPAPEPDVDRLETVVDRIKKAQRPVLFAGGGVILSGSSRDLAELARKTRIPVATSLMGLGAFPGTDPLCLGMLGMHGTYWANMSIGTCDLLIAVGARFDDRVAGNPETFAPLAGIVHLDIDPASIPAKIPVAVSVAGDCKMILRHLNRRIDQTFMGNLTKKRRKWLDQISRWKSTHPLTYKQTNIIKPQFVVEKLYELTRGRAIITTEVGQNQMWAALHYLFDQPGHFITSGGLGCMGFGLPAAIGAQVARPDKLVIDIAGDGSIQMNIQEMATAVQSKLPIKVVILNNRYLGMVRQWQELFYGKRYACTSMDDGLDFVKLAEAYGAVGLRATRPEEVEPVLLEGISTPKTVIMDFAVDPEESVYPMVPTGAPITEMLTA